MILLSALAPGIMPGEDLQNPGQGSRENQYTGEKINGNHTEGNTDNILDPSAGPGCPSHLGDNLMDEKLSFTIGQHGFWLDLITGDLIEGDIYNYHLLPDDSIYLVLEVPANEYAPKGLRTIKIRQGSGR